jgi:hypothetical protein
MPSKTSVIGLVAGIAFVGVLLAWQGIEQVAGVLAKPPKVALIAIMRKLLILANALLRDGRTWIPKLA